MISENVRVAIRPISMLLTFIWAGEFFSFGVYYFIANQAASQAKPPLDSVDPMLPVIFCVMAGVSLFAGLGLKWFVFSQRRAQAFLCKQLSPIADKPQDETLAEKSLIILAKGSFQPYLMSLGLINTCIIFGMVLSVMQQDLNTFMPFLTGSVAGSIFCFPRVEPFVEASMQNWKQSFRHRT